MNNTLCLTIVVAALWPLCAAADDSSAVLGAGGLVLTENKDIRMASEDLRLSPREVQVRYEFVNESGKDIDTIVAFPLPDIDLYRFSEEPLGTTKNASPNFVGFELTVNGQHVTVTAEERAIHEGKDVTAIVKAAHLPVNLAGTDLIARLDKLSPDARRVLGKAGVVEGEGNEIHPKWIAVTRFWWRQHFPARKTVVIAHRYQPVTGQSFFSEYELSSKDDGAYYDKTYCLDATTKTSIREKLAEKKRKPDANGGLLNAYATDFVLTTANNWKGPIGHFHLTLDKLKAENVLSTCWEGRLAKTSATTFESTLERYAPRRDIRFLVLE